MYEWRCLAIVDGTDVDDGLSPILSETGTTLPVGLTPADGRPRMFTATGIEILESGPEGLRTALDVPSGMEFHVLLTDCRLILYCAKYDKGSTWIGLGAAGVVFALGATAVSAARAAHRRKGKLLAGHVRYQWVSWVLAKRKGGRGTGQMIRLAVSRPDDLGGSPFVIQFSPNKMHDCAEIAADIVQRISKFRLGFDQEFTAKELADFQSLTTIERFWIPHDNSDWGECELPSSWPVPTLTPAAPLP